MYELPQSQNYLSALTTEGVSDQSAMLDTMTGPEIARLMNQMDADVTNAVARATDVIGHAIESVADRMRKGGRLFYIGAGTSGRLGVLDASECPPTFGVSSELVQGIIAGGDHALRFSVEGAEDDETAGENDLKERNLTSADAVAAISASGYAPYCAGALRYARQTGALAISICCNEKARLSAAADIAIELPTGSEALSGSTRLKAGTATKMALNMLSTGVMVRLGKVYRNYMVNMRATNSKLRDRSERITANVLGIDRTEAAKALAEANGDVKVAIVSRMTNLPRYTAEALLTATGGRVREAIKAGQKGSRAPSR